MGLPNFPYAWYVNILRTKLWEEWSRWVPPGSQQNCLVTFVIQRSGAVTAIELERTSGDPLFDQGALRAIQTAAPFPPLPEGFQDPTLSVHVEFRLGT
ncbi:MAG: TonB C-terminal domain-containing protein [Elusimicrobia bacterium]|nr:TonB C-terminal domain-containing protein [Elusimicrobiota bacterium]